MSTLFDKIGAELRRGLVQIAALALDRLHLVEGDAWNFLLVAGKPTSGDGTS